MRITIDLTKPTATRNPRYAAAIATLGKWQHDNDCDIIGYPKMPREIADLARYVDDCDEQATRSEHTYRAYIDIVRSPEEGNCYWGRGYGQEYVGDEELGERDDISCGLHETRKEAEQRCTRIAHAIARTIRLTDKVGDFFVGPLQVKMQLGSYKGHREDLAVHLTVAERHEWNTPASQIKYCGEPKWVDESALIQAAKEWSDAPDDIRCPLYAAMIQQIAAMEKTA